MLDKNEYCIVHHKGQKVVLCERIDMLGRIEQELLQGTHFAYKCPPERDSVLEWKKAFEDFTKRSFSFLSSYFRKGRQTVFTGKLSCIHRRKSARCLKNGSKLDFGCPTQLRVRVQPPPGKRNKNPTRSGYNLRVCSNLKPHNHCLEMALKYRRISDTTKAMLIELFDQHHTVDSAMEALKLKLLERLGDEYLNEASDRAVLPDKTTVTGLFYQTYRDRYGDMRRRDVRKLQEDAARRRHWLEMLKEKALTAEGLKEEGLTPEDLKEMGLPVEGLREEGLKEEGLTVEGLTVALNAEPVTQLQPVEGENGSENGEETPADEFMDSFEEPGDAFPDGALGSQISFGAPSGCLQPDHSHSSALNGAKVPSSAVVVEEIAGAFQGSALNDADVASSAVVVENIPGRSPAPEVIVCFTNGGSVHQTGAMVVESTDTVSELPAAVSEISANVSVLPSAVSGLPASVSGLPAAASKLPAAVSDLPAAVTELPAADERTIDNDMLSESDEDVEVDIETVDAEEFVEDDPATVSVAMPGEMPGAAPGTLPGTVPVPVLGAEQDDLLASAVSSIHSSSPAAELLTSPPSVAVEPVQQMTPGAEETSREITEWAAGLCRQLTSDTSGKWSAAVAAFLETWELLPVPARLKALSQFGRVAGLGRPPDKVRPETVKQTETMATQTETWTDLAETGTADERERTGDESERCGDERERTADERERTEDERERTADETGRWEDETEDWGDESDADDVPGTPSPYFRSLCVLRNRNYVSSSPLPLKAQMASELKRRGVHRRGIRD